MLEECKDVAAKRRRQSTRLENLGIPEEELLRQQQELFARARAEQEAQQQQVTHTLSKAFNKKLYFAQHRRDQVELSRNLAFLLLFNLVDHISLKRMKLNFSQQNPLSDVGLATKAS